MGDLPNTMCPKFDLVALPGELRRMIYKHLIQDVHMILDHDKIPRTRTRSGQKNFKPIPTEEMIKFVRRADTRKIALLLASAFCNKDAIDILASKTTIEVPSKNTDDEKHDILALVDPGFLKHVPAVYISPDSFLRFDRTLLPRLKAVRLTAWPRKPSQSLSATLHELSCRHCGDPQATTYLSHYWVTLRDVRWKRSRLRQLARDAGWDMDLLLRYDRFRDRHRAVCVELLYGLHRGDLVSKQLKVGDEVMLPSCWFSNKNMLMALGYSVGA